MRQARLAIAIAALVTAAGTCRADSTDPVASIAQQAANLYSRGDLTAATSVLQQGVRQHSDSPQLHFMLANAYFREHQWNRSIHEYQRSAALQPKHPDTFLSLGYAHYRASQFDNAVRAWKEAVDLSPTDALPHISLAIGLLAQNKADEAGRALNQGMHIDPYWRHRLQIDVRCTPQMVKALDTFLGNQRPRAVDRDTGPNTQVHGYLQLSTSRPRRTGTEAW